MVAKYYRKKRPINATDTTYSCHSSIECMHWYALSISRSHRCTAIKFVIIVQSNLISTPENAKHCTMQPLNWHCVWGATGGQTFELRAVPPAPFRIASNWPTSKLSAKLSHSARQSLDTSLHHNQVSLVQRLRVQRGKKRKE